MQYLSQKPYRLCLTLLCVAGLAFIGISRITTHAANAGTPQDQIQSSWGMYGFDGQHSQYNPYETVLGPSNVSSLTLAWTYKQTHIKYTAQPAVANGLVYISSSDGKLLALDETTGALRWLWNSPISTGPLTTPTIANGIVYLGTDALYALDATTGAWLWDFSTKVKGDTFTQPVVMNGVIYVGSSNGKLYALNATTGAKIWVYSAKDQVTAPIVANGVVYIGSAVLYALDAATGTLMWSRVGVGYPCAFSTTLDLLYTCGGNILYALGTQFGTIKWKYSPHEGITDPAVVNGVVYINASHAVIALDGRRGKHLWVSGKGSFNPRYADISSAPPIVANGVLYVDFMDATTDWVYAISTTGGGHLWSYAKNVQEAFPVVANGMLFVGSDKVCAFHLP